MPNIKSAEKRVEIIRERTLRNAGTKSLVKTAVKKFEQSLGEGIKENAQTNLVNTIKTIDKAVKKGVLHKNAAARKKSKLQQKFNGQK